MIDPKNITKYNQTTEELEEFILFWICAAGKNAHSAAKGLDNFLSSSKGSPFEQIRYCYRVYDSSLDVLGLHLKYCGIGCYNQKARTFLALADSGLNLHSCSAQDLETIPGIGMKTSRCFILHSRKNAQYAGLDVHILRFLGDNGYNVPKQTPSKKKYLELEKIFLDIAEKRNVSPAELDLDIWKTYSERNKNEQNDYSPV